jgi:Protein of unknown function (DUF3311)
MSGKVAGRASGLIFSPWNLFLVIPLLMLITPWFNFDKPRVLGLPFFYWYQFAFVLVGVGSVAIVYVMTRDKPVTEEPERLSVDDLDEGEKR